LLVITDMNTLQIFFLAAVISFTAVSCMSSEKAFHLASAKGPFDAIIVPGVPYDTAWSRTMKGRVLWSHYLFNEGIAKNIIYSGSAVYTPFVEGIIMSEYGKAMGIPAANIYSETRAEHSTENLHYSIKLAKANGFKNIALATDPYQNVMLKSFAKRKKMEVTFIPFITDTLDYYYRDFDVMINPSPAKVSQFTALPDRESFFKRLMGTMGFNIKEVEEDEKVISAPVVTISNPE